MEIQLLKHQQPFVLSKQKKKALLGGIGTGKSFSLAHICITLIAEHKGIDILLCANTYTQLMNATVKALTTELDNCNIPYKSTLSGAKKRVEVGRSTIYLYSLEKPDNIRGIEVGALLIDEAAYASEYAYKVCVGRLRQKNMPLYIRMASSPNGYTWLYDLLSEDSSALIKARTKDNIFLPKEYYEELLELYGGEDSPLAKQELFGEFVNLNGLNTYWAFERDKNASKLEVYDPSQPVFIGVDFNIDNMNAAVMQRDASGWRVVKHIQCGEYNSNTYDLRDKICAWLTTNGCQIHTIVPDSTGKARKTNSPKTDTQILRDAGLNVASTRNPVIKDRQNNVNRLFKLGLLRVSSSEKKFVKELETLSRDDKEGDVAHATVAMGYVLWKYDPMKRARKAFVEASI